MNYEEATGKVPYKMTNNYLFIAVLQEDKYALKGLIASLLHMDADEIKSIEIENPIMLGADKHGMKAYCDCAARRMKRSKAISAGQNALPNLRRI